MLVLPAVRTRFDVPEGLRRLGCEIAEEKGWLTGRRWKAEAWG
jgi:hypothetical protein